MNYFAAGGPRRTQLLVIALNDKVSGPSGRPFSHDLCTKVDFLKKKNIKTAWNIIERLLLALYWQKPAQTWSLKALKSVQCTFSGFEAKRGFTVVR